MLVWLSIPSETCVARTDAALAGRKRENLAPIGFPFLFQPSFLQVARQLMLGLSPLRLVFLFVSSWPLV